MSRWHFSAQSPAQVPGELVSALMDGQLRGPLLAQTAQAATQDLEALTRWRDYHLIGEALRAPAAQQTVALSKPAFLARLEQRMTDEGLLQTRWPDGWVSPGKALRPSQAVATEVAIPESLRPPAKARRRMVSKAMAKHAAMAAMGSMAVVAGASLMPDSDLVQWAQGRPTSPQQVAMQALTHQAPAPLGALSKEPMLHDRRLQEFFAAHQQAAGNSASSLPGVFSLKATFERKADAPR